MEDSRKQYLNIGKSLEWKGEEEIDAGVLLSFDYQYPDQPAEITIDTEEFTALCPWTGLPDTGTLTITYEPSSKLLELKSLKYYILSYRDVGIVQEHAANRILKDLVYTCHPKQMTVVLNYGMRGGLHTSVTVQHPSNN
jgi:7-cyano-7-deazaguanine reductase